MWSLPPLQYSTILYHSCKSANDGSDSRSAMMPQPAVTLLLLPLPPPMLLPFGSSACNDCRSAVIAAADAAPCWWLLLVACPCHHNCCLCSAPPLQLLPPFANVATAANVLFVSATAITTVYLAATTAANISAADISVLPPLPLPFPHLLLPPLPLFLPLCSNSFCWCRHIRCHCCHLPSSHAWAANGGSRCHGQVRVTLDVHSIFFFCPAMPHFCYLQDSVDYFRLRRRHVEIQSFQDKINLFRNPPEAGICPESRGTEPWAQNSSK